MKTFKSTFIIGMVCFIVIIFCIPVYSVQEIDYSNQINSEDTVWVNNRRILRTFINDRLTEEYEYNWDNSSWTLAKKLIYSYNVNNNLIEESEQNWDSLSWRNNWKHTYTYDENNNLIEIIDQNWESFIWINSHKSIYTYDESSNLIEKIEQDGDSLSWTNQRKETYEFDVNNNLIEEIRLDWDSLSWINFRRFTSNYDDNNNMIEKISQKWNSNSWVNYSKYIVTYDENDNKIEELYQNWDGGSWVNNFKYTYTYDANRNMLEYIYQQWISNSLIYKWKTTFYYKNDLLIKLNTFFWNESNWVLNDYSETYKYDLNDSLIEYIEGPVQRQGPSFLRKYLYCYDGSGNLIDEITQYAFLIETAIDKKIPLSFQLHQNYPNPLNPTTTISYELPEAQNIKLQIFDITGRLVETLYDGYKEAGHWDVTWDAGNQSSGVYIYRLQVGDRCISKKMIVLK